MSWNSRKEDKKLEVILKNDRMAFESAGMSEEQITTMAAFECENANARRRNERYGEIIPLYKTSPDGNEIVNPDVEEQYSTEIEHNPFEYGFEDERLNRIVSGADETDIKILMMLSQGYKQCEIAKELKISEKAISKRVAKFRKKK